MPDNENAPADDALFGKYELGKLLGCGAFAKVYRARNIQSDEIVAIKIINKKKIADSGLISNMKREITIMRNLQHSNIVKPYEVLATKSKIFIVMEYVKGGELFAKISKRRFREDLSRKYFHQLISAVGYCHLRGVYHRDLKPENLLLDEDGNLKVSDFGLSAMKEQIGQDGLLHTLCGTPAYVAPEVLSKKGYDGAKIDVWSCGVILFLLNAGHLPFNDPNLMLMYKKIYKGEFRCPKWFSADLRRFLSRLMDTNPKTRITVEEIVKHPWFTKGGAVDTNSHLEFDDMYVPKTDDASESSSRSSSINAFDLISFSSGLDLSALFEANSCNTVDQREERLMLSESPEKILEKVEEFGKDESLKVRKYKEWGLEIKGQTCSFAVWVEVYQLTDNLVVVEAKIRGNDAMFMEFWDNKLKPLHIASSSVPPKNRHRRASSCM